jgi:hypothetical protein
MKHDDTMKLLVVSLMTYFLTRVQPDVLPHFVAALAGGIVVNWYSVGKS